MPKNEYELTARAQAIQNLLTGLSTEALHDLGPHLNCHECEVLAGVFLTHGHKEQFNALMAGHVMSDDQGDCREHVELKRELEQRRVEQ